MTVFWVISGLLVAGALLFVLPPLLARREGGRVSRSAVNIAVYRDQLRELEADLRAGTLGAEHYEKARRELEARLLEDVEGGDAIAGRPQRGRGAAIALGVAVPLTAIALYLVVGSPQMLSPQQTAAGGEAHGVSAQQIEALVERVVVRLKANPEDAEGWIILARSYSVLGRFPEAARAYANAVARIPRDARLLADYADALAMAQGRRLQGEPENLIA
ncbi:MAG: c-type cytochrome biogenesis protein CcmI, partial [Betaproteobacteria bacterium]|nr:c-type cytochrome biogenesis protein CcmI [Betaproteobacteria bacterium]